ncbi:phospholipase, patatin family protein [Besnoitia besnoiti]|uniref:Phospholipase, patatin family protein n=1 Tax=Besnoitia besnoiti TaxID=94643 RepID=A0A2A9M3W7_BESBE|nr:phospholipase, patatin family protein [Besnoitia besnoiti]PFH32639.1 phospholipase, patatin family protein [Besnoitia besnoiti]
METSYEGLSPSSLLASSPASAAASTCSEPDHVATPAGLRLASIAVPYASVASSASPRVEAALETSRGVLLQVGFLPPPRRPSSALAAAIRSLPPSSSAYPLADFSQGCVGSLEPRSLFSPRRYASAPLRLASSPSLARPHPHHAGPWRPRAARASPRGDSGEAAAGDSEAGARLLDDESDWCDSLAGVESATPGLGRSPSLSSVEMRVGDAQSEAASSGDAGERHAPSLASDQPLVFPRGAAPPSGAWLRAPGGRAERAAGRRKGETRKEAPARGRRRRELSQRLLLFDGMLSEFRQEVVLAVPGYYAICVTNKNKTSWDSLYLGIARMRVVCEYALSPPSPASTAAAWAAVSPPASAHTQASASWESHVQPEEEKLAFCGRGGGDATPKRDGASEYTLHVPGAGEAAGRALEGDWSSCSLASKADTVPSSCPEAGREMWSSGRRCRARLEAAERDRQRSDAVLVRHSQVAPPTQMITVSSADTPSNESAANPFNPFSDADSASEDNGVPEPRQHTAHEHSACAGGYTASAPSPSAPLLEYGGEQLRDASFSPFFADLQAEDEEDLAARRPDVDSPRARTASDAGLEAQKKGRTDSHAVSLSRPNEAEGRRGRSETGREAEERREEKPEDGEIEREPDPEGTSCGSGREKAEVGRQQVVGEEGDRICASHQDDGDARETNGQHDESGCAGEVEQQGIESPAERDAAANHAEEEDRARAAIELAGQRSNRGEASGAETLPSKSGWLREEPRGSLSSRERDAEEPLHEAGVRFASAAQHGTANPGSESGALVSPLSASLSPCLDARKSQVAVVREYAYGAEEGVYRSFAHGRTSLPLGACQQQLILQEKGRVFVPLQNVRFAFVCAQGVGCRLRLDVHTAMALGMRLKAAVAIVFCGTPTKIPRNPNVPFELGRCMMLTFDGGGVLTYATLLILRRLERELRFHLKDASIQIASCFDVLAGSGFGGLLALGFLRGVTVSEMLRTWSGEGDEGGGERGDFLQTLMREGHMRSRVQQLLVERLGGDFLNTFSSRPYCLVTAADVLKQPHEVFILRSYEHTHPALDAHAYRGTTRVPLWVAGWATCADGTHIKTMAKGDLPHLGYHLEPAVQLEQRTPSATNPTLLALEEMSRLASKPLARFIQEDLQLLLSVGTGHAATEDSGARRRGERRRGAEKTADILANALAKKHHVHREVLHWLADTQNMYYRLNPPQLSDCSLYCMDSRQRDYIRATTESYLTDDKFFRRQGDFTFSRISGSG